MKKAIVFILVLTVFSMPAFCQFRATMANVVSGNERTYQVYSDLVNYRYEFEESGMKGVVIVMPKENKTMILMPEEKFVHITTTYSVMSRMNDPVATYRWYADSGSVKDTGKETVSGRKCVIREIYSMDMKVFTVWYSNELNFPVRIQNEASSDTHMLLSNIKSWKTDPSFFKVPAGYTEVDSKMRPVIPEPPPPSNWKSRKVTAPFEGKGTRGDKITISIEASVNHKLRLSPQGDKPSKIIWHHFRNGAELPTEEQGPESYRTKRLFPGEKKTLTYSWQKGDEIVIEVYEGTMDISAAPE